MTRQDILAYLYNKALETSPFNNFSTGDIATALHSTAATVGRHLAEAYRLGQVVPFRIEGKHIGNLWRLPTDYDIETKKHTTQKPRHMRNHPPEQLELL